MQARYRPGLPPVLKELSFTIPSGSTCGVVGRTGSGKSSLLLALFDLIDITGGFVLLDDLDVSKVALDSLRQQIAIIPQDPLLFSGV
jgi:ABC-type multidrug transport system fused ATPase/permease subunit